MEGGVMYDASELNEFDKTLMYILNQHGMA